MKLNIPEYAARVISALEGCGYEAYVVGGCVRDVMLGKEPSDWDVTTSAKPHEVRRLFSFLHGFTAIPTGVEHGTITVLSEGTPVEVTTFRTDGEYTDCRRPDSVEFCDDLSLDLARRDFTVNAMAYSEKCGFVDPYGGEVDLKAGVIRCVGDAEKRFGEDALRILRALRFAAVLGFSLDNGTFEAALKQKNLLSHVSRERIGTELSKLVCGKRAGAVIKQCLPIITEIFPQMVTDGVDTACSSLERLYGSSVALMLAALLAETQPTLVGELLRGARLDKKTCCRAEIITKYRGVPLPDKISVRRLCREIGVDAATDVIKLGIARGERDASVFDVLYGIVKSGDCISLSELAVGGGELSDIGIAPKKIGDCLDSLLDMVIADELENEKSVLLDAAKRLNNM